MTSTLPFHFYFAAILIFSYMQIVHKTDCILPLCSDFLDLASFKERTPYIPWLYQYFPNTHNNKLWLN